MTDDTTPTWPANRARINGLWPRYEPTDAERELTVSRLSNLNQRWLAAAIDAYRCATASTVFRLAELLDHYRAIANTGESRTTRQPTQSPERRQADALAELEHEREQCIARLRTMPRADVAAMVAELRKAGWLALSRQLPGDFAEWPRHAVFAVCARADLGYTVHAP